jgi:hypothetical protein
VSETTKLVVVTRLTLTGSMAQSEIDVWLQRSLSGAFRCSSTSVSPCTSVRLRRRRGVRTAIVISGL